jgi:hypothetical protein
VPLLHPSVSGSPSRLVDSPQKTRVESCGPQCRDTALPTLAGKSGAGVTVYADHDQAARSWLLLEPLELGRRVWWWVRCRTSRYACGAVGASGWGSGAA